MEDKKSKPEREIERLTAEEAKHRANGQEFRAQFSALEVSLQKFDAASGAEIEDVLNQLPDASPKALVDKVLQLGGSPKRDQLMANIAKLKIASQNSLRKAGECRVKIKGLEKQIDQTRFSSQAYVVFEKLGEFLDLCKQTEAALDGVKDGIFNCEDPQYFTRAAALGFETSFEVICGSFLKREYLNNLGVQEILERVANLGDAYGPALLRKDNIRLQDVPLVREAGSSPVFMQVK